MGRVSDAVEKADPAVVSPLQAIQHALKRHVAVINRLLPEQVSQDRFLSTITNAVRADSKLARCDPDSLVAAALRAAQAGLEPNDGRNLCWLIPYDLKVSFQLGYGGVLEFARRAMPGIRFDGRAVHENDEFDLDFGRHPPLHHRPALGRDRGAAYAWYVRALYPDGSEQIHALDRAGVEYHRSFSKQPGGKMWTESYDAAALKSVVLDMRRWLPQSPEAAQAIAVDGDVARFTKDDVESEQIGPVAHQPDKAPAGAIDTTADDVDDVPPVDDEGRPFTEDES